jgi:DNA invertase Pin-like site-specific DNA recombinase
MLLNNKSRRLRPRNPDGVLRVILIGRVSKESQQASNIRAGYEYALPVLKELWDGEVIIKELGEVASGMRTDRASIMEAEELIAAGWPDLVLMEDLSKAYRNPRFQLAFVQDCFDARVRVIAVGDNLDTADENWEVALQTASNQHGTHVTHTRRRVRRSAVDSFRRGGWVLRFRAGYRKLTKDEAASGQFGPKGLRIVKLPEWAPRVDAVRRMILDEILHSEDKRLHHVVDWVNDQGFPTGPYVNRDRWTLKLLIDWLRDPMLCGWRRFRQTIYEYVYGTGSHRRERNADPEREHIPELGFMTQDEWDELQAALNVILGGRSNPKGEQHPRHGVPRHHSISPNQHMECLCESFFHACGKGNVKCANASHKPGGCWSHVQVDAERARAALVDTALAAAGGHPEARRVLLDAAWEEFRRRRGRAERGVRDLDKEIASLKGQAGRLAKAIKLGGPLEELVAEIKTVHKALKEAEARRQKLVAASADSAEPATRQELDVDPRAALLELARTSFEFSDLMRRIFPQFVIQPVQALDSGLNSSS